MADPRPCKKEDIRVIGDLNTARTKFRCIECGREANTKEELLCPPEPAK